MFKYRMGVRAIDVNFGKHGEGHLIVGLTKSQNLFVGAWILFAELIAGKSQHLQPLRTIGPVEFFQAFEMRGESALAGRIDDEQDLAPKVAERFGLAAYGLTCDVIQRTHGLSSFVSATWSDWAIPNLSMQD